MLSGTQYLQKKSSLWTVLDKRLLLFNEMLERFFPGMQINLLYFSEGTGGYCFVEKPFAGRWHVLRGKSWTIYSANTCLKPRSSAHNGQFATLLDFSFCDN